MKKGDPLKCIGIVLCLLTALTDALFYPLANGVYLALLGLGALCLALGFWQEKKHKK